MDIIAIGGDVSKGRLDIAILNQSYTRLHAASYDDTALGHQALQRELGALRERYPGSVFVVGLESTGGLERNWLAFLRDERRWAKPMRVHQVSPLAVQRHLSAEVHRAVTDRSAAEGIARYLLERVRDREARTSEVSPAAMFYRTLCSSMRHQSVIGQQIQALLIQVHPELVQYCRAGLPAWIIALLGHYPTAARLARARVETLASIPFVTNQRAEQLVANACTSIAGLSGIAGEATMSLLIGLWRDLDRTIAAGKKTMHALVAADPLHTRQARLLETIPGIGAWTACALSLECGDFSRFDDDRALIAWCGLDPHEDRSGDGVIRRGISHRGNAHVRQALFMPAFTAIQHLPAVAALYARLSNAGKPKLVATVACMNKLLRIAYAVIRTGRDNDSDYEQHRREEALKQQQARSAQPSPALPSAPTPLADENLAAPVSAAEARRRRIRRAAQNAAARALQSVAGSKPQRG